MRAMLEFLLGRTSVEKIIRESARTGRDMLLEPNAGVQSWAVGRSNAFRPRGPPPPCVIAAQLSPHCAPRGRAFQPAIIEETPWAYTMSSP
jgi:hypothetical protein